MPTDSFTPIDNCVKRAYVCYPNICDDLCIGCPINGWENEDELTREDELDKYEKSDDDYFDGEDEG